MDRADNIRRLKEQAKEPKVKKAYSIPKVSEKRKKQIIADKELLERDKEFYADVWAASPHKCEECNRGLGEEPLTLFFHHALPKRNYPQYRHTHENIIILCPDCHQQAETDLDKVPNAKKRTQEIENILLK